MTCLRASNWPKARTTSGGFLNKRVTLQALRSSQPERLISTRVSLTSIQAITTIWLQSGAVHPLDRYKERITRYSRNAEVEQG